MTTTLTKLAADEKEAPFEQAFANLAYQYLQDKAPRLLDFVIGFQLVDRNEDNTKAVGVFGFKVGDQWLYQPVFFLSGDIKGHELLYMKDADQFVPMRENWVNYLMSRKPNTLGESTHETTQQLGVLTPNMEQFSVPPGRYGKYGSVRFEILYGGPMRLPDAMAKDATQKLASWQSRDNNPLNQTKLASTGLGLEDYLAEGIEHIKVAHDWYGRFPAIRFGVDKFYGGEDLFKRAAMRVRERVIKESQNTGLLREHHAGGAEPLPGFTSLLTGERPPKQAHEKGSVEVIRREDALFTERRDLTEEDRERLLEDGLLVKDTRPVEEVDVAYQVQHGRFRLQNPTESNLFDVLLSPTDFQTCLVINFPYSCRGRENFVTVVPTEGDDRHYANAEQNAIWVKPDTESHPETFQEWVEGRDSASLERDTWYVAVSPNGQGTCPFRVEEDKGDDKYKVRFRDSCDIRGPEYPLPKSDFAGRRDQDTGETDSGLAYGGTIGYYDAEGPHVCINHKEGAGFKLINNDLYVPSSAKIIRLKSPKVVRKPNGDVDWEKSPAEWDRGPGTLELGNLVDLQHEIMNKTSGLRVWQVGPRFVIEDSYGSKSLDKRAALMNLVLENNLSETQARDIVKTAETKDTPQTYRVKRSQRTGGQPFQGGGGFLTDNQVQYGGDFPEANTFTDDGFTGIQAQSPQVDFQNIQDLQSYQTDPELYNPNTVPDPMALQEAQTASQEGQKEVFDTAMLSSMLKVVREDSLIDKYLPDLMKALDRLGRILFLFYWHGEEFEDRYGKQDMPELEDTLRNSFETMGDVTLFLKQKTVEPHGGAGGEVGEPTIDDSARN
jgi:hypothetical protein